MLTERETKKDRFLNLDTIDIQCLQHMIALRKDSAKPAVKARAHPLILIACTLEIKQF